MIITFACGHDERLDRFIDHHRKMIPGKIVTAYGGPTNKKYDINADGKYIGDGHLVPRMKDFVDDRRFVLYVSHDALILEHDFIDKSMGYMIKCNVDVLAPSLSRYKISPYTYGFQEVYTSIICLSLFKTKAFLSLADNWMKGRPNVSEEVEFWETPHRAGFKIEQNPYIIPSLFTCRSNDEERREGGAIHPHKEWK